jgi:hypothetical protein
MAKTRPVLPSPDWRAAFPFEETRKVVGFVTATWNDLVARNMPKFQHTALEPHLTVYLRGVLQQRKEEVGLTGNFGAEELDAEPDLVTGELSKRSRADIRYFSDRTVVDLTFEFKKLKNKPDSRRSYYGQDGMKRFVDGKYSRDKHLAFMVGIVATARAENLSALKRAIAKPDIAALLHILRDESGAIIREPSRELPAHTEFDTEHSRLANGNNRDIVLCHLFLDHPPSGKS